MSTDEVKGFDIDEFCGGEEEAQQQQAEPVEQEAEPVEPNAEAAETQPAADETVEPADDDFVSITDLQAAGIDVGELDNDPTEYDYIQVSDLKKHLGDLPDEHPLNMLSDDDYLTQKQLTHVIRYQHKTDNEPFEGILGQSTALPQEDICEYLGG